MKTPVTLAFGVVIGIAAFAALSSGDPSAQDAPAVGFGGGGPTPGAMVVIPYSSEEGSSAFVLVGDKAAGTWHFFGSGINEFGMIDVVAVSYAAGQAPGGGLTQEAGMSKFTAWPLGGDWDSVQSSDDLGVSFGVVEY